MYTIKTFESLPLQRFPATAIKYESQLEKYLDGLAAKGEICQGTIEKRVNKIRYTVVLFSKGEPSTVRVLLSRSAGINNFPTSEPSLAKSVDAAFNELANQGWQYRFTLNKNIGTAVESYYVFYKPLPKSKTASKLETKTDKESEKTD